jgi:hypothetical protein
VRNLTILFYQVLGVAAVGRVTGEQETIEPKRGQITARASLDAQVEIDCPRLMTPVIPSATFEDVRVVIENQAGQEILDYQTA